MLSRKKPIIGLCGGIGAGKSRVAAEFGRLGCQVIEDDRLNHEVLRRPEVVAALRAWWGPDVVDAAGAPDRRRIAEIIFADEGEKRRLEGLLHPLIEAWRLDIIKATEDNSAIKAIVIDSPLLFESSLDRECDAIVFIDASADARLRRLQATRGWSAAELRRRERWQKDLALKRSAAGFVVDNEGPPERLVPQVAAILSEILARHSRGE